MIGIRISDSERAKDIVLLDYFNFYITMTNTLYNYYLWLHVQYNSFIISSLKVQQSPCVKGFLVLRQLTIPCLMLNLLLIGVLSVHLATSIYQYDDLI